MKYLLEWNDFDDNIFDDLPDFNDDENNNIIQPEEIINYDKTNDILPRYAKNIDEIENRPGIKTKSEAEIKSVGFEYLELERLKAIKDEVSNYDVSTIFNSIQSELNKIANDVNLNVKSSKFKNYVNNKFIYTISADNLFYIGVMLTTQNPNRYKNYGYITLRIKKLAILYKSVYGIKKITKHRITSDPSKAIKIEKRLTHVFYRVPNLNLFKNKSNEKTYCIFETSVNLSIYYDHYYLEHVIDRIKERMDNINSSQEAVFFILKNIMLFEYYKLNRIDKNSYFIQSRDYAGFMTLASRNTQYAKFINVKKIIMSGLFAGSTTNKHVTNESDKVFLFNTFISRNKMREDSSHIKHYNSKIDEVRHTIRQCT